MRMEVLRVRNLHMGGLKQALPGRVPRARDFGFRVEGVGFRAQGLGFRVGAGVGESLEAGHPTCCPIQL